jgi:hypothetical protein
MRRKGSAALAATVLLALLGAGPTGAAATKPMTFTGRIVSATGRYANLRGSVRLVLRSPGTGSQAPAPSAIAFTLTLTAPACKSQAIKAPRRCASLHGTLSGTAQALRQSVPDVGRQFTLAGHGSVAPLGGVTASGTTSSLGFIARGRIPLTLKLTTHSGRVTVQAQGPLVNGFTSPF